MMDILPRVGRWTVNALFHISLFTAISVISLVTVFGSSKGPKQALQQSGAYSRFVDTVIDGPKSANQSSSLHLDDPNVRKIANNSFPAALVQASAETTINGVYDWLEGKSQAISFKVDLRAAKQNFGDSTSTYAFKRVQNLPFCKNITVHYDPFTTDCQIPLVNIASEQKRVASQIAGSPDILPNPVITDNNLPKTSDGQRLDTALAYVPSMFKWVTVLPYLLGGFAAALGLLIVRMQRKARKGITLLAGAMASDAIFLGFSTIVFGKVLPAVAPSLSLRLQGGGLETLLDKPVQILSDRIENAILLCCLVLLAGAACLILLERGTRPASPYKGVRNKAGLAPAGIAISKLSSKNKRTPASAPIQSSEQNGIKPIKKSPRKKYSKLKGRGL